MNVLGNNLSEYIKIRRKQLNLSQVDVHYLLGWKTSHTQYLSNIELGKCQIPIKHLNRLSIALQVNRETLIEKMVQDYKEALMREVLK